MRAQHADSLRLLAPAKLNLFLHILGRRDDGYHDLQTVFQLLDYGDTLQFEPTDDGSLSLHLDADSTVRPVPLEDNLILRAARQLKAMAGAKAGVRIRLNKQIPMGAGLGGGSSDAATTLLALNRLWQLGLDTRQLQELGRTLGADVPVFVLGQSAWGEGIGEQLEPVSLPPAWYVVLTPQCQVSTAAIFGHENLTRNSTAIKMADFLAGRSRNDCETVTRGLYSEVDSALAWLGQYAPARMTGTGAAVFASFADEDSARTVFAQRPAPLHGFIARGVNSLEPATGGD